MNRAVTSGRDELVGRYLTTIGPMVVVAVHHRDRHKVADLIGDMTRDELMALTIALAEMNPHTIRRADDGQIDEVAIERSLSGHVVPLTRKEKIAVAHGMNGRGNSNAEVGRWLQVDPNTVRRWLREPRPQAGGASELGEVA